MKILVVDDDRLMLQAISYKLKDSGYEVVLAEDGYEALNIIDKIKIDLIISDVMMPNISGLGLLSLLKQFYF
ncbi:MAG TPA: response regulator, partial [Bacteroidia bacterium]|nr:response regulator [Bacteroidia bacterium]